MGSYHSTGIKFQVSKMNLLDNIVLQSTTMIVHLKFAKRIDLMLSVLTKTK